MAGDDVTARPVAQSLFPEHVADKPVGPLPLSVQTGSNADLMWAIRDLYLTGSVLDVTYGEGAWWRRFQPDPFAAHDLYKLDGVDFRALPEADRSWDTVCFDPPYVVSGTHGVNSVRLGPEFQNRYGIGQHNLGMTTESLRALVRDGLAEGARVARRFVLVKCMEYAQGGPGLTDMPHQVRLWGHEIGAVTHDVIVHNTGTGPGGHNIWEAKRCRRAHSYLLVFAVPA